MSSAGKYLGILAGKVVEVVHIRENVVFFVNFSSMTCKSLQ